MCTRFHINAFKPIFHATQIAIVDTAVTLTYYCTGPTVLHNRSSNDNVRIIRKSIYIDFTNICGKYTSQYSKINSNEIIEFSQQYLECF